jgi:hypothetical protein
MQGKTDISSLDALIPPILLLRYSDNSTIELSQNELDNYAVIYRDEELGAVQLALLVEELGQSVAQHIFLDIAHSIQIDNDEVYFGTASDDE